MINFIKWLKNNSSVSFLPIAMLLLLSTATTNADEMSGHISGFAGLKIMDSSDWPELNTHFAMGVLFDIKKDSWPISIAVDIFDTGDEYKHDGIKDLGHTTEYQLGIRKIFMDQNSKLQPYIGGGVSFMSAELEYQVSNNIMTQDDRDVGVWLGTGMYYEINPSFVLGLDVRYSYGKVILFDNERDAGGLYTGLTAGFQF
jgi:hypothetical protein